MNLMLNVATRWQGRSAGASEKGEREWGSTQEWPMPYCKHWPAALSADYFDTPATLRRKQGIVADELCLNLCLSLKI